MPDKEPESSDAVAEVGTATLGAVVGLAIGGPIGAVVGAAVGPATKVAVSRWVDWYGERRIDRVERVLQLVVDETGVSPEDLVKRASTDPQREALFVRTLRLAQDASLDRELLALARALGSGLLADEEGTILWEQAFVAAVGRLTPAHLDVLARFAMSAADLGLGTRGVPDFEKPIEALNEYQVDLVFGHLGDVVPSLISTLQSEGLLRLRVSGGGGYGGGGGAVSWSLSEFGRTFLTRLGLIEAMTRPAV